MQDYDESQIVTKVTRSFESRRSYLGTATSRWRDISTLFFPRMRDGFYNINVIEGQGRNDQAISSVGLMALNKCANAIVSIVAPQSQQWHGLETPDTVLNDNKTVQLYFEDTTHRIFSYRYAAGTAFQSQLLECFLSSSCFGTGVLYTEANLRKRNVSYLNVHLGEIFAVQDEYGEIRDVIRRYQLRGDQAVNVFAGVKEKLPRKIIQAAENGDMTTFTFLHCVHPNPRYNPTVQIGPDSFEYVSYHVLYDGGQLLRRGGYNTFPYHFFRLYTTPGEIYGRGFGDMSLEEIKETNAVRKADMSARHMAFKPPMLAKSDMAMLKPIPKPGVGIFGGLDDLGRPTIQPYIASPYPNLGTEVLEQSYRTINSIFMIDLFQILIDDRTMTATEVNARARERLMMYAPVMSRLQDEGLASLIVRELDIHSRFGHLAPPPSELTESGNNYEILFKAPLNTLQRSQEGAAAEHLVNTLAPWAQVKPEIIDMINFEAYARTQEKATGAPASTLYSPEELQQRLEAKAQAQQEQQMVAAMPEMASSMKDIAQAQMYAKSA